MLELPIRLALSKKRDFLQGDRGLQNSRVSAPIRAITRGKEPGVPDEENPGNLPSRNCRRDGVRNGWANCQTIAPPESHCSVAPVLLSGPFALGSTEF